MEVREVRNLKKHTEQTILDTEIYKDEIDNNIILERTKKMWIKALSKMPGLDKTKTKLKNYMAKWKLKTFIDKNKIEASKRL
jgi:hypothetical protein